jgi:hypothetical protein
MQNNSSFTYEQDKRPATTEENGHQQQGEQQWFPRDTRLPQGVSPPSSSRRAPGRKQLTLIAVVVSLLLAASALLLPILLAQPGQLATTSHPLTAAILVGRVFFTSSGQLNPTSSEGLNDVVHLDLADLTPPAPGKSDYAWLLPDTSHNEQQPVLLGTLQILRGSAQLKYTSPTHTNLLATYSRFLVNEQAANEEPIIPSLDSTTWRYAGSIPDTPTPGDANHYSLLSHLRHLLAKDPTLEGIGLSGGLDIWLYRNTGKILEWSSAARDDWAGGQSALALMRRQIDRVLDYLDGAAFVWRDVPPDTPLLVDPKAGRIGLLEFEQGQNPPGYLAHIDFHLVGYTRSPGVTADQKRLANKIDGMLITVTALLWKVHGDASLLAKMSDTALLTPQALSLLNDMEANANDAFVGQPDPATGSVQGAAMTAANRSESRSTTPNHCRPRRSASASSWLRRTKFASISALSSLAWSSRSISDSSPASIWALSRARVVW